MANLLAQQKSVTDKIMASQQTMMTLLYIFDLGECLKNHKSHQQPYFLHSASGNFYFALSLKIMLYSEDLCIQCNSACGVCFR